MQRRKAARLSCFDYSTPGAYFVTACAHGGRMLFADPFSAGLELNAFGRAVQSCWAEIPTHFDSVDLDAFVVMPNHVHGVLLLNAHDGPTLPTVVGSFKSAASRKVNRIRGPASGPVWQRGYYERIVRNEAELEAVREYVLANPAAWCGDPDVASHASISASAPWL